MEQRILIIGLDGATWDVLSPAIEGGYMPTLKRLRDEGAWGPLRSTIPAITPAAWSSFQTGCNPGQHGVLDFSWWDRTTRKLNFVSSRNLKHTLWQRLGQSGGRVGVINVPMTYPPQPLNGYLITGILTPSRESDFTYPPDLKQSLLEAIDGYHIFNLSNIGDLYRSEELGRSFLEKMVRIAGLRVQAVDFLLKREPLDALMVHFQVSDVVQHALWHWLDPKHPRFDPDRQRDTFDLFYRPLDQHIAEVIRLYQQRCGTDSLTCVLSDHGFQLHRMRFNLGVWLYQQGYLSLCSKDLSARRLKQITQKLRIGKLLRPFLSAQKMQSMEKKIVSSIPGIVWEKSRAFASGRSGEGYIYLLEEGTAREHTAQAIIEGLLALRYPGTGEPIVQAVHRKENLYHGSAMDRVPDLIIIPADGYSCTGTCRPQEGLFISVTDRVDFHQGKHHPDGIYIFHGPAVKPIRQAANLIDLSCTLSALSGADTSGMEGIRLKPCFNLTDAQWKKSETTSGGMDSAAAETDEIYSVEDEEQIRKRLEDLGYL